MRLLTLALVAATLLGFASLTAEPADAAGMCVSGVYSNMGHPDGCGGVACYGYSSQTGWQTCVPPR